MVNYTCIHCNGKLHLSLAAALIFVSLYCTTDVSLLAVVKVVMCSRGGAEPLRSRRTKISIQCCIQKLHFKLTAPVYPAPGVECFSKANTK